MTRIALSTLAALVALATLPAQAQRNPLGDINGLWLDPSVPDRVIVFAPPAGAREVELPIGRAVVKPMSEQGDGKFAVSVAGVACTYAVNPSDGTMSYALDGYNWLFRLDVKVGRRMTWQRLEGPTPCPQLVLLVRVDASLPETHQASTEECDRLAADPWDMTRPVGIAGVDFIGQVKAANPLPACQDTVDLRPGDGRRIYQLARVLDVAERAQVGRNGRVLGSEAIRLYQRAAKAGHPAAKTALGEKNAVCRHDQDKRGDAARAAQLFREAAEAGHIKAMRQLARLYSEDNGVSRDLRASIGWYRKAVAGAIAAAGSETLMRPLGRAWFEVTLSDLGATYRLSAESPDQEVIEWFRSLAMRKILPGVEFMEWVYREGRGAPRDPVEADRWRHVMHPPVSAEERARRSEEYKSKCVDNVPRSGTIEWCRFMRHWK